MNQRYRYQSIFTFGSLQSVGHTEEYFAKHTRKLVINIVMPRLKNQGNLLRVYFEGKLIKEEIVWSSTSFFSYYLFWFYHYWKFLLVFFGRNEKFIVLAGHPIFLLGMTVQKLLRPNVQFAYWIGDYSPPVNLSLWMFEKLKKYYHDRVSYAFYLSDIINQIFNKGKIMNTLWKKTVMWGVNPIGTGKYDIKGQFNILFVGLLKEGQGIELLLSFLAKHQKYTLKIIGICPNGLFRKYQELIAKYHIVNRVFFPNKFYTDSKLARLAKTCHVGVAFYETGLNSSTYYTDPGKVKTYIEMGLPVIMSHTSAISPYIVQFGCGEVVDFSEDALAQALVKIQRNYIIYKNASDKFNEYFYFENYYKDKFKCFEQN